MDYRVCEDHCNVEKITFTHKNIQTVWRGHCINHSDEYIAYHGMDSETGKLYVIKEIAFDATLNDEEEVTTQLSLLIDLKHDHLFAVKNFCQKTNGSKVVFYILQESTFGYTNLSVFLSNYVNLNIKSFWKRILGVKNYLEEQQISLRLSSLFVNANGEIKVYDYGLISTDISSSELLDNNFEDRVACYLSGKSIQIDDMLDYQQNLNDLNINSESLHNIFQRMTLTETDANQDTDDPASIEYKRRQSRMDFERIERLGKGGFGKVYKIRDNTDDKYYALKKIKLSNNNEENSKIMREVKYLSELEHKHVVRYFHSWKEPDDDDDSSGNESESEDLGKSSLRTPFYIERNSLGIISYSHEDTEGYDECDMIDNQLSKVSSGEVLYIKMELCENTLADVIEKSDLYKDRSLIWIYFKQILEGLHHIHGKGIIHRDLKPSNIFLDPKNQIKIGDFGFATNKMRYHALEKDMYENQIENRAESCTSRVGTSYYKAPELLCDDVVICDHKLDMYSLGIILFELCCKPFDTQSERAKVMSDLRSQDVTFPTDFNSNLYNQKEIIRILLDHNPSTRFDCEQLMKHPLIPHISEEKEEEKQLEMIKRVSNDSSSKLFRYFLDSCFELYSQSKFSTTSFVNITQMERTLRIITRMFEKHGGKYYVPSTTYLTRKCDDQCTTCVQTITNNGLIKVIPCSSRIPFLRYILSRSNYWERGYSIYKEWFHNECTFDIITPINLIEQNCFLPDAEMLLILSNLAATFKLLFDKVTININHTELLEAILEECNFIDNPAILINLINLRKRMLTTYCTKLFPTYNIKKHIKFLEMTQDFKNIDKFTLLAEFENQNALIRATQALSELSNIIKVADEIGVHYNVVLQMNMFKYVSHYSGMVVELTYYRKTHITTTVATAGRYDRLLKRIGPSKQKRFGVGLTIFLQELYTNLKQCVKSVPVLIWADNNSVLPSIHNILKIFWNNNIDCHFIKVLGVKNCFRYTSKNSNAVIVKVSKKLVTEGNFIIIFRMNSSISKWIVHMEDLVVTIKTLLFIEPIKSAVLTNKSEVSIRFSTKVDLPFQRKVKYKCEVVKELNKRDHSKETILVIVVDFDSNVIKKILNKKNVCGEQFLRPIYEEVFDEHRSAKYSIVLIARIPEIVEDPLNFVYCNL